MELCSVLAHQTAEPLIGTASQNTFHFVMAWPKRDWLPAIEDMDNAAGRFARLIQPYKNQVVLSLTSADAPQGTLWLFPHGYRFDALPEADYTTLLEQALNRQIEMPHTPIEDAHVMLVCTHGKRDTCCAKFGVPVLNTLREQATFPVWEVSHLGGHRFAATLVVQPESHWYGQLTPADVPALLDAIEHHTILGERYRGNAQFPPPLQAAEYWAWQQESAGQIHLLNPKIQGNEAEVVVSWQSGAQVKQAALTLTAEKLEFVADCTGGRKDRLVWQVTEVKEYAAPQ